MNEPVRAVLAIAVALLIVAMLAFARGEPLHGTTTQSASVTVIAG
ncbi:MAG TPA: hypothetical protein VFO05_07940 [Candidatus Limnocylindrales bacterium]|nr:hypothetical protein [Candidatus Limnocylindrales bacterium]